MDFVPVYIAQSVLYWVFIVIENPDTLMKENEIKPLSPEFSYPILSDA